MKNYKKTLILIVSVIIGSICGLIFKDKASVVKPLGDLFLNLLFVIIVPLIFFTLSSSISKMKQPKRLGKILTSIILVFIFTSIIAVLIGMATSFNLVENSGIFSNLFDPTISNNSKLNILERTINTISVGDFSLLLSKDNLIALIVMSILFGLAVNKSGEKGRKVNEFLDSFSHVMYKLIDIIMYYAPIGLGCYFAALIGDLGSLIAVGFLKTFVVYLLVSIFMCAVVYSLYAYIAFGRKGIKLFWKNVWPAIITSLGTCSSAASVPVNIDCAKNMGVPNDIAETTISLGTSFHKDGSTIGSAFKIMFLVSLFGTDKGIITILLIALLATLLVTAVPIGGGTISELLIITLMGYPVAVLPILTVIATIIDAPATMLNVIGDESCAMLVTRMVDGKNFS